jgi:phage baseplate assembly protein gpV
MSVRVAVGDRVSDWLPMSTLNNGFVRAYVPPTTGQQVAILNPFGDADGGLVIGTYGHKGSPEPDGGDDGTAVVDFGGVRFAVTGDGVSIRAAGGITLDTPVVRCTENVDVGEQLHAGAGLSTDGDVTDGCGDLSNFTTTDGADRAC